MGKPASFGHNYLEEVDLQKANPTFTSSIPNSLKKKKKKLFQFWVSLKATSWLLANPSQLYTITSHGLLCPLSK